MKVLVSTTKTQGQRPNDFCWATEGEIVTFAFECDREPIDGSCGCRRALSGTESKRSTTTMMVVDLPDLDLEGLATKLHAALVSGGWAKPEEPRGLTWAKKDAAQLATLANAFPVGAIVEKRGQRLQSR